MLLLVFKLTRRISHFRDRVAMRSRTQLNKVKLDLGTESGFIDDYVKIQKLVYEKMAVSFVGTTKKR